MFRSMEKQSIGILGGSFDPVHKAHMALASEACKQGRLDKLLLVPARQAALKDNVVCASDEHRLAMLELSAKKLDVDFQIELFELQREGVSFSIDTAKHLRKKYPQAKLFWIIGSDHISKLSKWKDINELCQIVEFICAKRPNYSLLADDVPACAKITYIDFQPLDISSTEIRENIKLKKNLNSNLDTDVISYINEHKLYQ